MMSRLFGLLQIERCVFEFYKESVTPLKRVACIGFGGNQKTMRSLYGIVKTAAVLICPLI